MKRWIGWVCGLYLISGPAVGGFTLASASTEWTKIVGDEIVDGTAHQELVAITSDDSGNLYVAGFVDSDIDWQNLTGVPEPVSSYSGARDIYVAKLDSTGTPIWHTCLGGGMDDSASALLLDGGYLYVTGDTASDASDWGEAWGGAATAGEISANGDIFLVRLEAVSGTADQLFLMGGPNKEVATGIAKSTESELDYFYLVGSSEGGNWGALNEKSAANPDQADLFVVKLDTAGAISWHGFYGSTQNELAGDVLVDADTSSVYVTGTSFDAWGEGPVRPFTGSGSGTSEMVVLVLETSGDYRAHTFLGGSSNDSVSEYRSLALEKTAEAVDRLYVIGRANSATWGANTGEPVRDHQGSSDIVIASLGSDLSFSPANGVGWYSFYGGSGSDEGSSIQEPVNDRLFFAGHVTSDWEGLTPDEPYSSGNDGVVGMIDSTTGELLSHSFAGDGGGELLRDMNRGAGGLNVVGGRIITAGSGASAVNQYDGYVSYAPLKARLAVFDGASEIAHGATLDLGAIDAWSSVTRRLVMRNVGADTLAIDPPIPQLPNVYVLYTGTGGNIVVSAQPNFSSTDGNGYGLLAPGAEVAFEVTFDPDDNVGYSETISIYQDAAEQTRPYQAVVTGTGEGSAVLNVRGTDDSTILSGTTATATTNGTDFGTLAAGQTSVSHSFTIENDGSASVSFADPAVYLTDATGLENFTITEQPSDFAAKASEGADPTQDTFDIQFTPQTQGDLIAKVTLEQQDGTLYTFYVSGTATGPKASVTGNNADISKGSDTTSVGNYTDFGQVVVGEGGLSRSFSITNNGTEGSTLELEYQLSNYVVVGGDGAFSLKTDVASSSLARGDSTSFEVAFDPTEVKLYSGSVTIWTNDPEEGVEGYSFAISGQGAEPPFTVNAGSNQTVALGDNVVFDGSIDGQVGDYTATWDFGDGTRVTGENLQPDHLYTKAGDYTVSLTVTDDNGSSDADTLTVTVTAADPVADFSVTPSKGAAPLDVVLDYSASNDPDGEIVIYDWEVNGTPISVEPGPIDDTKTITFNQAGTYTIALTVTDNDGLTDRAEHQVTVDPSQVSLSLSPTDHTFGNLPALPSDPWDFNDDSRSRDPTSTIDLSSLPSNRIVVFYEADASAKHRSAARASFSGKLHRTLPGLNAEVWVVKDPDAVIQRRVPGDYADIEFIEPDYPLELLRTPSDPAYISQWGLHNQGADGGYADADIDAPEAWDLMPGGDFTCAVVDTGVDLNHPDLIDNLWTNPNEIPGNGLDDDLNGYVDDVHGVDFTKTRHNPGDGKGHGTHVAGIFAGRGDNGQGGAGVNWKGKIMSLKIFDDYGGGGWSSDAAAAIKYAVDMGARCSNHSWSTPHYSKALHSAVSYAEQKGHLIIAGAGNEGRLDNDQFNAFPANLPNDNVISVCASDRQDLKANYSHYGRRRVDLCAPGSYIYSTTPDSGYGYNSGTSMAAPHVTGAVSLIWAQRPDLAAQEVKRILLAGVDRPGSLASVNLTGGRLNLYSALTKIAASTRTFTLTNEGPGDALFERAWLAGTNGDDFEIHDNACSGQTLAVSQSCTLRVSFAPQTHGYKEASLNLSAGGAVISATLNAEADYLPNGDSGGTPISSLDTDGDGIPNLYDPQPETQAPSACQPGLRYLELAYAKLTGTQTCQADSRILTGNSVEVGDGETPTDIRFEAGSEILLFPGFRANAGSRFRAIVTGEGGDEPVPSPN